MMKNPYIKKIGERGDIDIWLVNGFFIRKNIDIEFTNFGHHFTFGFIPKNEFWIDLEHKKGETKYFIDHMLVEHRLMAEGKNKYFAMNQADRVERQERMKSSLAKNYQKVQKDKEQLINKVHKELLNIYSKKVKVWVVNGELVRDFFYLDFTEGGHDKVFSFIPTGEIWLDDDLSVADRKFVMLHELHERNLMSEGHDIGIKNGSVQLDRNYQKIYNPAHLSASKLEYFCRHHPAELEKKLQEEIVKS